jgi:3',5'-cyclic AMP phosphodiesterase CpdA
LVTTLVHLSDPHFGRDVDLEQIRVLEDLIGSLRPTAVVLSGDLTQRARHGELQRALRFVEALTRTAPVHVIPGNHDVQWWETPFHVLGARRKYAKYRRYFGEDLSPTLSIPGAIIAGALTSHGVVAGSMTWKFWRDTAVKGHLPASEVARVQEIFRAAPAGICRVVVTHHNILRGEISRRMGLARWRAAQTALARSGADLVLCGHDHQEGIGTLDGGVVVSTASTFTNRTRGHRPSAFNVVAIDDREIAVHHRRWDASAREYLGTDPVRFPRRAR